MILAIIEKMRRPKLLRVFQIRGNWKRSNFTKHAVEAESLQRNGLLDVHSNSSNSPTPNQNPMHRSNTAQSSIKTHPDKSEAREDYAEFSKDVAGLLIDQDDDLDGIGNVLVDVQGLAVAMNNELKYHEELISRIQGMTDEASSIAKENAKKIATVS